MCGICSEFSILPFIPEILGGKGRPDGEFRVFPCFAALKTRSTERRIVTFRGSSGSPKAGPTHACTCACVHVHVCMQMGNGNGSGNSNNNRVYIFKFRAPPY